jgi:hypothetical protein
MAQVVAFPARAPIATGEVISLRQAKADMKRRQRVAIAVERAVRDVIRQLDDGMAWGREAGGCEAFSSLVLERLRSNADFVRSVSVEVT